MSELADDHRRIAEVLEPLERMGIDATVDERTTDDGSLCLTLTLGLPSDLDPIGDEAVDPTEDLEARVTELEKQGAATESNQGTGPAVVTDGYPSIDGKALTDGERGTLNAIRELDRPSPSGDIADEVDATLQSVRSWLPKLVQADLVQTVPDPTDGRRKLYSSVECDEPPDEGPTDRDDRIGTAEDTDDPNGSTGNDDSAGSTRKDAGGSTGETDAIEGSEDRTAGDEGIRETDRSGEGSENRDGTAEEPEDTDGPPEGSEESDDAIEESVVKDGTVYIASSGGSPSQVFHVRPDCPQLQRAADFVEKDRSVVPHHRPCGTCVSETLADGLVAISKRTPTETYHKRRDCPRLESAVDVAVQDAETATDLDPCADCVSDGERSGDADEPAHPGEAHGADDTDAAAEVWTRNDLDPEAVIEALTGATTIYHVQRDLTLAREETEVLLEALGVFETLADGGHVTHSRAKSVVRDHVGTP